MACATLPSPTTPLARTRRLCVLACLHWAAGVDAHPHLLAQNKGRYDAWAASGQRGLGSGEAGVAEAVRPPYRSSPGSLMTARPRTGSRHPRRQQDRPARAQQGRRHRCVPLTLRRDRTPNARNPARRLCRRRRQHGRQRDDRAGLVGVLDARGRRQAGLRRRNGRQLARGRGEEAVRGNELKFPGRQGVYGTCKCPQCRAVRACADGPKGERAWVMPLRRGGRWVAPWCQYRRCRGWDCAEDWACGVRGGRRPIRGRRRGWRDPVGKCSVRRRWNAGELGAGREARAYTETAHGEVGVLFGRRTAVHSAV
jgi:hypothetical protein